MTELKSRPLKISLSQTDLNGKYGDDVEFTADLSTVKDVITGAEGAIGPENCLKLRGGAVAATALYVLVRSIKKNWPWLQTTNVEMDVLQVSFPPKREKQFTELMETNVLEQRLVENFKNLHINLESILGEETFDQCGENVLKLLKDIRIKSIGQILSFSFTTTNTTSNVSDLFKGWTIGQLFQGGGYQKITNRQTLIVVEEPDGPVFGMAIDSDTDVTLDMDGCRTTIIVGFKVDDLKRVLYGHKRLADDYITVKISIGEGEKTSERKFKPTTTIDEVIMALKKEEKEFYDLFRDGKKLDGEMTLADLGLRLTGRQRPTDSGLTENMVVGKIVLGTHKVKESGRKTAVLDRGNYETKGIAAAEFIGKGGVMEGEASNGSDLVAKGYGADEAVKLAKAIHGNAIKVKIRGEMLSSTFEDKFDPTMTIEEVCETIQKQEKLAKKITLTREVGELTDEMTLAEAESKGPLVKLKAKFFDERN